MTLIKTISGIRGTIGGYISDSLNPMDIVRYTTAYAQFIDGKKIVVGRDCRRSGLMVHNIVVGTLMGMGYDVVDIGCVSTPTTSLAVLSTGADGGIIITASHNPVDWNALKLLNRHGEYLNVVDYQKILSYAENGRFNYADVYRLGKLTSDNSFHHQHINAVLNLNLVDVAAIRNRKFRVCVDTINSVGSIILPELFQALNVDFVIINGNHTGDFNHNPDLHEKNLHGIIDKMKKDCFDLGIVVDSDVDSVAFICEDGTLFGEEYTLVAAADYVLSQTPGHVVSDISCTRALRDVTQKYGGRFYTSTVGESNVTEKMKEVGAVIGGDGNGGIIYPELHYGRDALVGIALILTRLAQTKCTLKELRNTLPDYKIIRNHIDLTSDTDVDSIFMEVKERFVKDTSASINDIDGLKIDYPDRWVHLRKSNTEPVVRVYSEAETIEHADDLGNQLMRFFYNLQKDQLLRSKILRH
ncbi:phosphoglucosamine mutase [Prevotella sp. P6B1]|uniref:phosphoglucosamine mutase n=1 Tax=Prevotella sp. P6B1 TaxID=1410613 RepID=UPI0006896D5D|nr:phosphoglucosamine mutase [Prevotella sp. P6B1]